VLRVKDNWSAEAERVDLSTFLNPYSVTMRFSVIIPLFNRPQEIDELLESLTHQTYQEFEVLVVEDGSTERAEAIVEKYSDRLDVTYFFKENSRQGFTRNFGFERAKGDWLVVFDSDCLIPSHYFQSVVDFLVDHPDTDVYGGPDAAAAEFSDLQKAISYSMTSPLTTGGIRGNKRNVGVYHPRSFNMGISRKAWETTGGYRISVKGEDVEFSIRILEHGLKTALITDAFVYHKRRTSFSQFRSQVQFFGRARVNIRKFYPGELKPLHWMPALFLLYCTSILPVWLTMGGIVSPGYRALSVCMAYTAPLIIWSLALLLHAMWRTKSLRIALLALRAGFIQLTSYGWGLLDEYVRVVLFKLHDPTIGEIREVPRPQKH